MPRVHGDPLGSPGCIPEKMVLAGENGIVHDADDACLRETRSHAGRTRCEARFPDKLEGKPAKFYIFGEPLFQAEEVQKMLSSDAQLELVDSTSINPEWGGDKVLKCGGGSFFFDIWLTCPPTADIC